jgi:N-acetylglucosamine-6-phosphate deacetylase
MDTNVTVELICDGLHIHPAVVRSVFKMFGAERVVLVSDAMRACGLTNGNYELGGQPVILKDGRATLSDGTLAGSATDLLQCMRNAVSFGIPVEDAVRAASFNPAQVAGAQEITGSIDTGRRADLLLVDNNLELKQVIIAGSVRS